MNARFDALLRAMVTKGSHEQLVAKLKAEGIRK